MKKVLIVDDSKTVRLYHKEILKQNGYEPHEAENGMEALEKSLVEQYELFLVDVNMPIMDGYSFISDLRKQAANRFTPIVMVTTQAKNEDKINAYKVGSNLFETKPIKPDRLKAYLDILVEA